MFRGEVVENNYYDDDSGDDGVTQDESLYERGHRPNPAVVAPSPPPSPPDVREVIVRSHHVTELVSSVLGHLILGQLTPHVFLHASG